MKVKLSSVLDLSRFLVTKSGKELKDVLDYLSQLSQQVITALTNNLSYEDNFSCEIKNIRVLSGVQTKIKPSKSISVKEVRVRRVYDNIYFVVNSMGWNYDSDGSINFKVDFGSSVPSDYGINLDIIILYG